MVGILASKKSFCLDPLNPSVRGGLCQINSFLNILKLLNCLLHSLCQELYLQGRVGRKHSCMLLTVSAMSTFNFSELLVMPHGTLGLQHFSNFSLKGNLYLAQPPQKNEMKRADVMCGKSQKLMTDQASYPQLPTSFIF